MLLHAAVHDHLVDTSALAHSSWLFANLGHYTCNIQSKLKVQYSYTITSATVSWLSVQ